MVMDYKLLRFFISVFLLGSLVVIVIYSKEANAMALFRGVVIEETINGVPTKTSMSNKSYRARIEADLLRDNLDKARQHEITMATLKANNTPSCVPPVLSGPAADTDAGKRIADAYYFCMMAQALTIGDDVSQIVSAATGNSLNPGAQMYRSHNSKIVGLDNNRTERTRARLGFAGAVLNPLIYGYYASKNSGTSGGQTIKQGDGSSITLNQSNSGAQGDIPTINGNELGEGLSLPGGAADQTRIAQQSIFGHNGYATASDQGRLGFSMDGFSCVNDVSGTINCFDGTQKSTQVTDTLNQRDFRTSDDDGFNGL